MDAAASMADLHQVARVASWLRRAAGHCNNSNMIGDRHAIR